MKLGLLFIGGKLSPVNLTPNFQGKLGIFKLSWKIKFIIRKFLGIQENQFHSHFNGDCQ